MKLTKILVLGGGGFVGRYALKHLQKFPSDIVVGTRGNRSVPGCEMRQIRFERIHSIMQWEEVLRDIQVVINCVGILRERGGETYEHIHHIAVGTLAEACKNLGIRLVHVSALGLSNPLSSQFSLSKRRGEDAIRRSNGDWAIVRASLVDGPDGYGASWFRRLSRWPIHLGPTDSTGGFSPITAEDLGEILANLSQGRLDPDSAEHRVYEVGCGRTYRVFEYLSALAGRRVLFAWNVPVWLTRLAVNLCDRFDWTPLTEGHYELLKYPNVPQRNRAEEVLGRPPRAIEAIPGSRRSCSLIDVNFQN